MYNFQVFSLYTFGLLKLVDLSWDIPHKNSTKPF